LKRLPLYAIIQSATEPIITVDENQRIVIFNAAAEKVFRCSQAEALGSPLERFIPERFRQVHDLHIGRFSKTGVSERRMGQGVPLWGLRADGEEFAMEASISQAQGEQGIFFTAFLRDITERQQVEQALRSSRDELTRLSAALQTVREEEKKHIARELHDDLGQMLTALNMGLSLLESALPEAEAALQERFAGMHRLVDGTFASLRRIAAHLRPTMLDDLGLPAAIEWLLTEFHERYGISALGDIAPEASALAKDTATALFRIVQEALTNVARHADASHVRVSLLRDGAVYRLEIEDDGAGAAPESLARNDALGLIGIRERVRQLGGSVTLTTQRGRGFRLQASVKADQTAGVAS
jgi:PAS domain S-box-containing protein